MDVTDSAAALRRRRFSIRSRVAAVLACVAMAVAGAATVGSTPATAANADASTGIVSAWSNGGGYAGESGVLDVPADLGPVVQVAAGVGHALALRPSGEVVAWGDGVSGNSDVPESAKSDVTQIAAGYDFSLALKSDGSVIGWGDVVIPSEWQSGITKIDAFGSSAMVLKADGTAHGWPGDNANQAYTAHDLEPWTTSGVKDIAAGGEFYSVVTTAGSVVTWSGQDYVDETVTPPASLSSDVVAVDASMRMGMALKDDGSVVVWGASIGSKAAGDALRAVPVAASSGVTKIALSPWHALALKNDGTVVGWGSESSDSAIPVPTERATGAIDIAAGRQFGLVVQEQPELSLSGVPPQAAVGQSYSFGYALAGPGSASVAVTAGQLPANMWLSSRGVLSGYPVEGGEYTFTVTATAPWAQPVSLTSTIRVLQEPAITGVPSGVLKVGEPFSFEFPRTGYPTPTFDLDPVHQGSLPTGLTLSAEGVLSGTPTTPGSYAFKVRATNAAGSTASIQDVFVFGAPAVEGTPPEGTVGVGYDFAYTIDGYPAPTATHSAGALPAGLDFASETGSAGTSGFSATTARISGTPTRAGRYPLTVTGTISSQWGYEASDANDAPITVNPATSGQPRVTAAPPSLQPGAWEHDGDIRVFAESYNQVLTSPLTVGGTSVPAGTRVNSYYVHADAIGNANTIREYRGSISFGTKILAVVTSTAELKSTAPQFGTPGIAYSSSSDQGLEYNDAATTGSTVGKINLAFKVYNTADAIRIITLAP